jgi:tetrahydromethanopterin S-methyltransferase subunit G
MNSNQDLKQVNERLDQLEQKLDNLGPNQQKKRSAGVRFLIGFGITIAVIFVLMLTLGVIQFVSNVSNG